MRQAPSYLNLTVLDDTSKICMMLRNRPVEYKTKVFLGLPDEDLRYVYDVALRDEHFEICRVIKLILDLRGINAQNPPILLNK